MTWRETKLRGVYVLEPAAQEDERGFFVRVFDNEEFKRQLGISFPIAQASRSQNKKRGTIRGMHYQKHPAEEQKLVQCVRGRIYDVVLDLREGSETLGQWIGEELSAENLKLSYVPKGCAHGFQTLEDNTEVFYCMSEFFSPDVYSGVRWDDPAFRIAWPLEVSLVSERDKNWPVFSQ